MNLLKYIALLLSLVSLLFSSESNFTKSELQWIKENPIVNFGADYKWPPFDFSDSNGNHIGLASEYIKLISKKSGLKINVQTGIWSDILNGMKAKKYDGLTCAVETNERKKYLKFTTPYLTVPMVIITTNKNSDIKNINDLKGRKVAINKGSYIHEWLENKYSKINLHLTTSNEASLEAVSMGIADAYVGNQAAATFIMNKYLLNNLKIVSKLKDFETAVSVAIDKDNIMLFNIIQKSLNSITINEHQDIKSKWKKILNTEKESSNLIFTNKQKEWIKNNPVVTLGADYQWPPFDFVDSSGNHTGLASEYIKLISKKSGLIFDVTTGVWSDIINGMKDKKYDGLTCAVETDARKSYLKFTDPYLSVPTVIVIPSNDNSIKTIDDLISKSVSINKGSYTQEWLETHYPKINLHLTTSSEASLEAVSLGKADAYIGNLAVTTYIMNKNLLNDLKIITKLKDFDTLVSVAIDKDKTILFDIVQKTLKSIIPQEHQEIKKRWKENLEVDNKLLTFTKKQQMWINNHKTIKFVIDNQWKPIEYLSEKDKIFKGISSSYLDLLSEKTGIVFKRIYTKQWADSVEKINAREADLYTCVGETDSRKKVVNFSTSYLTMPQVFVTTKNKKFISDIRELYGETIVLVKGYYITEVIKKEHPQINILEVQTIKKAFESLVKNKAYTYIEILPVASHYIQQEGFSNLKISGMSEYESEFSMALRNDWEKEGIEVINIALASITEEEKNNIYNKWLRVEYDKKIDYTLLWQIIGLFLFFILGTLYWNRKLSIEIKKRKIAQAKLIETNKKLEEAIVIAQNANKSKSDFLSNMSHEIRTPINTILGFTELLNKNIEDKKLKSFIKTIYSSGQTLLHLINDILDLSKIESGKMEIKNNQINLENVVQESFNIFKLQAEEKGLKLELIFDENISIPLFLDDMRLKEILINLIGNAIKFTDEGYIKILVKVDKHIDKVDLTFIVQDTGIGIPISQQKKIFNIFEQAENQDIKKYGGTGLGLSISKKSAILMGGNIELESKLGVGSKFIVNLKNIDIITTNEKIQTNISNIDFPTIEFKKAIVLVVDDIKVNRDLIKESFSKTNIEVLEAVNAKEAVEIIKINKNINLVFMDIRMSDMDGYSETKIIKKYTNIPVIALIASNTIDDFKKIKNKIFDGFLIKPILIEKLFQELTKYLPYNKVNKIEKIHKEIKIENSKNLALFLKEVNGDIEKLYKEVIKTNDINNIEIFIKKLYEVSLKYEIKYMLIYSELFLEKIDSFEIDAINSMLKEYKGKIQKLKDILNK